MQTTPESSCAGQIGLGWHFLPRRRTLEPLPILLRLNNKNASQETAEAFYAVRTRLELATFGVTGRHSNQLNYRTRYVLDFRQKRVQIYA